MSDSMWRLMTHESAERFNTLYPLRQVYSCIAGANHAGGSHRFSGAVCCTAVT